MFVIAAEFYIKPDKVDAFRDLVDRQGAASVAEEAGCLQFDVSQVEGSPDTFLLYEVYADSNAFDEDHVKIPRFEKFLAEATEMNAEDPMVRRLTRFSTNRK